MAFDPEARKRRRQEMAEKRKASAGRRQKLLLGVGIAAAVILLGLIVFLLLPDGKSPEPVETTPANPTETSTDPTDTQPAEQPSIHLVFGGDLNITDAVVAAGGTQQDYTETFMDVAHLLADADLAALNLEGVFANAPYGSSTSSAPQGLATALSRAGVDFLQLANSCSLNKGLSGLAVSIDNVRSAGMTPLGVYKSEQVGKGYVIRQVGDIKIAFVAFTKGMDGLSLPEGSEDCVNVLYTDYDGMYQTIDTERINRIMGDIYAEAPDITIAMLHWGSKMNDTISDSQNKLVELLQSKGVDAIIGTHSHYVQKMVFDPEAGSFVAYCLGDFFGDREDAGTEYSVLLDLVIGKDAVTGQAQILGYDDTPIFTVKEDGLPLRVVRIREAMEAYENGHLDAVSSQTYDAMKYALTRIEARITGK